MSDAAQTLPGSGNPPEAPARRLLQRVRPRVTASMIRDYGVVITFVVLFVVLSITTSGFLSSENLLNIAFQNAGLAIATCGVTVALICGGFDLSVGAVFALAGVVSAWVAIHVDPVLGLFAGVLVGFLVGVVNGLLILCLRIHSFLATLAVSLIVRALAVGITGGLLLVVTDDSFRVVGNDELLGLRIPTLILIVVFAVTSFALAWTTFGRRVYATGGNEEASRLSGVRVGRIKVAAFAISGTCAGIAGTLAASRASTGQVAVGEGLELTAIAAAVIGGTSINGGEGAIWRGVLGVFLLALINNAFNILAVPPFYRELVTGALILIAVSLNSFVASSRR